MKKGGTLGIIGATGCGKTTIINLLLRFYDADEGNIFINGKDVRTYDKDELHRMFGVVFQNDVIFADTLKDNISFGRKVSLQELENSAADAKAQEFIDNLELFSLLANVADVKSLAIHPASTTHSECNEAELLDQGIKPNTIRLSIGTENIDDIIEDLDEAFKALS